MIGINRINPAPARPTATSQAALEPENAAADARALVPVAPASSPQPLPQANRRPLATFLAQLIATKSGAPQTRELRRGTPKEALSHYRTAPTAGRPDPKFSRSM